MRAVIASCLVGQALAFPFVSREPGVDSSLFGRAALPGSAAACPYNKNHPGAAPYTTKYPYCGAKNGIPGKQTCPNNQVPAPGDTAHYYVPPGKNDIRGPCPGLNTAANHNFLSHDGITTFTELVDMQQNVYGVGYDLAVLLATLGVGLDGDPVTQKLSIGCDATTRTSVTGLGAEVGLDGHNRFEGDTSLTRNDYFLAGGDDFTFNYTLFGMMSKTAAGYFGRTQLALYRYQRYQQSLAQNGNFYFGPKAALLYGAASFLYELFPSLGELGTPSQTIMNYFFIAEMLPPNWFSRVDPYTIPDVGAEIFAQYQLHPVPFGGNTGKPNTFVGIGESGPYISPGTSLLTANASGITCLLYQLATDNQPSSLTQLTQLPLTTLQWAAGKLNPIYAAAGSPCPLDFNNA